MKNNYYTLDDFYLKTNIMFADLKKIENFVRILHVQNVPIDGEGLIEIFYEIHVLNSPELSEEVQLFLKKLIATGSPISFVKSFGVSLWEDLSMG